MPIVKQTPEYHFYSGQGNSLPLSFVLKGSLVIVVLLKGT